MGAESLDYHNLQPTPAHQSFRMSKWQNGNFINNWTPLIFFVLFHDY